MDSLPPSKEMSPWLRFVEYAEQISAPCYHDEGDDYWRVRSQSGGVYRAKTLPEALRDFWESEIRERDLDGNPTEPEPASAHEPLSDAAKGGASRVDSHPAPDSRASQLHDTENEPYERLCNCVPLAPRNWNYCQDCGGKIAREDRGSYSVPPPPDDLIAHAIDQLDFFSNLTNRIWPTLQALRDRLAASRPTKIAE